MFLRTPLIFRLPTALLRLCSNSAPSTASSAFYSSCSRANSVLSRCKAVATSTPRVARHSSTSAVAVQVGHGKVCEAGETAKRGYYDNGGFNTNARVSNKEFKRVCVLLIAPCAAFFLWLIMEDRADGAAIPSDAEKVDFDTFTKKYLGEVQKIVFVGGRGKAVGTLREGAVIDGEQGSLMANSGHIVFDYPHSLDQLRYDVRKEEAKMDIALSQKVDFPGFKEASSQLIAARCVVAGALLLLGVSRLTAEMRAKKPTTPGMILALAMTLTGVFLLNLVYNTKVDEEPENLLQTEMVPAPRKQQSVVMVMG